MRRRSFGTTGRRVTAVVLALLAIATLTGCDRPPPEITVLSGSTTVVLTPQSYCFDARHCHFTNTREPVLHAKAGTSLLVDVPREIADHPWSVSSGTLTGNLLKTFVGDNYSTGTVVNTHSARVDVPYGVGSYALVVQTVRSSTSAAGSQDAWVSQIQVTR